MDIQTKTTSSAPRQPKPKAKGKRKGGGDELKVVYISSPMKVRTSVARFRSLVQQLTGKNSDIAPYLDSDEGALVGFRDEDGLLLPDRGVSSVSNSDDTTSESFLGGVDSVFADKFGGFLSSETFADGSPMDVLGSYDELLI